MLFSLSCCQMVDMGKDMCLHLCVSSWHLYLFEHMYFVYSDKCFIRCRVQLGDSEKELVQFKSKWNISQLDLEFWIPVNCKYDQEEEIAHQGAQVCIYLSILSLYYTVYCINNWNDSNNNLGIIQLSALYFIDTLLNRVEPQWFPI